jgi:pimeloyl-ACP methyl ester carboxylesterase
MISEFLYYLIWKRRHPTFWNGNSVDVNDIRLYYEIYNPAAEGVPLLFLHGGTAFLESFFCQIPFFSKFFKVIAVDSRAHARSTDSDEPLDYGLMASDIWELLQKLHIPQVNLIGWSDGAIIGIDLAINHPEFLNKMVLSGANFHYSGVNASFQKLYRKATGDHWMEPMAKFLYRRVAPDPTHFNIMIEKVKTLWDTKPEYTIDQLDTIQTPTLILNGMNEEAIPRDHTAELAKAISGSRLIEIEGTGHEVLIQKPKIANKIILDFLQS